MGKSIFDDAELYDVYDVEIEFKSRCYGGQPKSEEILKGWIEAKGEHPREDLEEKEQVLDFQEEEERAWCGFRQNGDGIYLREFQIEALLSQAATTLGITTTSRGSKGIIQHGLFVNPREIHFTDKADPDGSQDIAGHVMTAQGKRSILKRSDFVEPGTRAVFSLKMLKAPRKEDKGFGQKKLNWDQVAAMLHNGQDNGIGSCRKLGGGKFIVTRFEPRM